MSSLMEKIISGFDRRIKYRTEKPTFPSTILFYQLMKKTYIEILEAKGNNKPLIFASRYAPIEIFTAMDIPHFTEENFGPILLSIEGEKITDYIDICDSYGVAGESCAFQKMAIGLAIAGAIPSPDFIVGTGFLCESSEKAAEIMRNKFGCPSFFLDDLYGEYTDERVEYGIEGMKHLIKFLEDMTKKKLDYDRLREVVEYSRKAWEYWLDILEFKKNIPCPLGYRETMRDYGVTLASLGAPEAVDYFENRYKETKEKADKKIGVIPDEKYRLGIWGGFPPFYEMGMVDWLAQEHKAVIVVEVVDGQTILPGSGKSVIEAQDPLEYMARKAITFGGCQLSNSLQVVSRGVIETCKKNQANAFMHCVCMGCVNIAGYSRALVDEIRKQLGIPTLIFDGDPADPRIVSADHMKERITQFFEMLEDREI